MMTKQVEAKDCFIFFVLGEGGKPEQVICNLKTKEVIKNGVYLGELHFKNKKYVQVRLKDGKIINFKSKKK